MAAPDDLYQTLAALKEAGASHAKFHPDGTLAEIQFAPEIPDAPSAAPQTVVLPPARADQAGIVNGARLGGVGYAQLFGDERPRFRPVDE